MAAFADKRAKAFYDKLADKLNNDQVLQGLNQLPGTANKEIADRIAADYHRAVSDPGPVGSVKIRLKHKN